MGSAPSPMTMCDTPGLSFSVPTEQAIEEDTNSLLSLESATKWSSAGNTEDSGDTEMEIIQGRFWMSDEDDQDTPCVSVEPECLAGYGSNTMRITVHDDLDWLVHHEESDTVSLPTYRSEAALEKSFYARLYVCRRHWCKQCRRFVAVTN